ncbi:adenosine receptor A1 [Exaiptasia diaphana]|uniref:G-protein coupled receptors family 1 profile domain-containing protein n=1 Tax=Exaiptasia diaphana TaxID=2652724 RepID=A0A913Y347_EXADI|nr:adenosine receptor A1 [Exaiptasia diaphana]
MLLFNDTLGMNVSKTTSSSAGDQFDLPLSHGASIVAINFLLSITGTFGNFLIIFAILTTPQLRQRPSNFLLLSLAVTDLLVTTVAQPLLASNVFLKTRGNPCARGVDMAFMMSATFSAGCSINHLAVISIDRALATVKPLEHHNILKHWYKVMLSVCWGSVAIAVIVYFSVKFTKAENIAARTLSILTAVYITIDFLIMIGSYAIIIYRIKFPKIQPKIRSSSSTAHERAMEKRVSGTIAILIFLFAVTWFPYTGYRISNPDTSAHCSFDLTLLWIRTLFLANSSMNFIVYSSRIRQFRTAYLRIITRMLQPFRNIAGKCFSASSEQQNTTQITVVPSSINTTSLSNEMQEMSEIKSNVKQHSN